jgi:hypothetical protein
LAIRAVQFMIAMQPLFTQTKGTLYFMFGMTMNLGIRSK